MSRNIMTMELSAEDAQFLHEQLVRHIREVEVELAHTDQRGLQHALAADLARLQRIAGNLDRLLQEEGSTTRA